MCACCPSVVGNVYDETFEGENFCRFSLTANVLPLSSFLLRN